MTARFQVPMAAPPHKTLQSLAGRWKLNKNQSDEFDQILAIQGVNALLRRAISVASVQLKISQPSQQEIYMEQPRRPPFLGQLRNTFLIGGGDGIMTHSSVISTAEADGLAKRKPGPMGRMAFGWRETVRTCSFKPSARNRKMRGKPLTCGVSRKLTEKGSILVESKSPGRMGKRSMYG